MLLFLSFILHKKSWTKFNQTDQGVPKKNKAIQALQVLTYKMISQIFVWNDVMSVVEKVSQGFQEEGVMAYDVGRRVTAAQTKLAQMFPPEGGMHGCDTFRSVRMLAELKLKPRDWLERRWLIEPYL